MNEMNQLKFKSSVLKAFDPIIRKYGYNLAESVDNNFSVSLISEKVSIDVTYEYQKGYDLDICFSLLDSTVVLSEDPFDIYTLYNVFNVPESLILLWGGLAAPTSSKLAICLDKTCEILLQYCQPILAGEEQAFKLVDQFMQESVDRHIDEYNFRMQYGSKIEKADQAWKEKRYKDFFNLLDSPQITLHLTELQKKKMLFALKKIQSS